MVRGLFNKNTPNKRALYVAVPRVWHWISESAHSHSCFACCLTKSKGIFEKWWTRSNVFPSLVFIYVALFQTSLIQQIWIRSNVGIRCLADPSNAYKGSQPVMGQKLWGLNRTNLILDQTQTLVIGIWILFFTTELSAKNQNLYNTVHSRSNAITCTYRIHDVNLSLAYLWKHRTLYVDKGYTYVVIRIHFCLLPYIQSLC